MAFLVKKDIAFNPINIVLLGFAAVMFPPHDIPDLIQQLWGISSMYFIMHFDPVNRYRLLFI